MQSDRIAEHWRTYGFGLWAAMSFASGRMLGFAGLSHPLWLPGWERSVEVGWRFRPGRLGQRLRHRGRPRWSPLRLRAAPAREIVSLIHPDNARSLAVAGRLGLTLRDIVPHPQRPHDLAVHAAAAPQP